MAWNAWAAERSEEEKLWAFQRPKAVRVPAIRAADWVRNPIDAFILARLEAAGLTPAPEASRETLIRRLTIDLTGLPPTPDEVAAFVRDAAPDAYERVVERLLASPRFGERWALFWLDLVRYSESNGFKADEFRPDAWRYRDYVIRSLNRDKPYDRFIQEQLAGDELFPGDEDALLATGYLRHYTEETNQVNLELRRQEILNDITDTTGQAFLGLTLGCARCHDHKFDPISQKDYFRLQAFFAAFQPVELPLGTDEQRHRYHEQRKEWEAKTEFLRRELQTLEGPFRQKFMASRKGRFPSEYQAMYETPAAQRTPMQQQIAYMVAKQVEVDDKAAMKGMKGETLKHWQEATKRLASFDTLKPQGLPSGQIMTDVGPVAPPTYLLRRGDVRNKGREVEPGFLSAIDERKPEVAVPPAARTTGRRAALARWLTEPDHPFTARVLVNRLWQHHFGRGLVATPSDFGVQGESPTHPELLNWLGQAFTQRGWSLKQLHRLMVTSATYRQSSQNLDNSSPAADSDNKLLSRMNRRRLEGEALRDAILAVAGLQNDKQEGPSIHPELPAELGMTAAAWPVESAAGERNRRSIYVFAKRNLRYPFFGVFDAPDGNEPCARRNLSTNAPQALMLLNDKLILNFARIFAERVLREAGTNLDHVIEQAYGLALGREPRLEERHACDRFLQQQAEAIRARPGDKAPAGAAVDSVHAAAVADLCHVLFNLNEFLYID